MPELCTVPLENGDNESIIHLASDFNAQVGRDSKWIVGTLDLEEDPFLSPLSQLEG